ncbi:MAG: MarR family transcriptional regulator [Akkermansiaceae bacterium]|nr:MarR family transcriptional regulator [Armatimonadota bacterium]
MTDETDHAAALERILPEIARRMFTVPPGSPLAELPSAQLKVCSLLLEGRHTMSQIGEQMNISVSAVTQIADRLERAGMVKRVSDVSGGDSDRRHRYLALTDFGEGLLQARREQRRARVASVLSRIPPGERETIRLAFERLLIASREV